MSERNEKPRSRATREWRERTGLKLVQIYLDPATVDMLDIFVEWYGVSGRSKAIEALIDDEADRYIKE